MYVSISDSVAFCGIFMDVRPEFGRAEKMVWINEAMSLASRGLE